MVGVGPREWQTITSGHPDLDALPVALRDAARLLVFRAGSVLRRRGERPLAMLYVLAGEVRLVRNLPCGSEAILQRACTGFIAEASLEAAVYHCDIVAAADGRLLGFPLPVFRAALERDPAFNRFWIGLLAREVRRLRARTERLGLARAADRILHYLETEGTDGVVVLDRPRKLWARELGLSHEALYRTLRRLRESGVVEVDGGRIALVSTPPSRDTD